MLAILKREVKSYFHNVIGWLFIASIVAIYGLYFFAYNLQGGYPYISYALSGVTFVLLIAVPILSMRCLAEERKTKTDQLLLTAPIRVGNIVLGKYFAMAVIFSIAVAMISLTPILLSFFGTIPIGESLVAILGFWLLGCSCLAIGLFISSLTESQVIAAVFSFVTLFLCFMLSDLMGMVFSSENLLTKLLKIADIYTPFTSFMNGCLDLTSVVYYLSLIGVMLFLTSQSIQKRRWSISKTTISLGVFSSATIAVVLAVTVIVNLIVGALPVTITSLDFSYGKMYELTEDTKALLKELEEDITIYVLNNKDGKDEQLNQTLERYESLSSHITVEYIDPTVNPYFYQSYTDTAPSQHSLIVVSDKRARVIDYNDVYVYEYNMDYYTYSYTTSLTGYDAEGQLTSSIEYVTLEDDELDVIYEITGHGESALTGDFTDALQKANIRLESLELFNEEGVPEDAQAIIINMPQQDFNEEDTKKVIDYIQNGGNIILNGAYEFADLKNFNSIMESYGLSWVDGIVVENDAQHYYSGNPFYLLPEVNSTEYTSNVASSYIIVPYSIGISYPEDTEEFVYTPLLETSESAVSKTSYENITTTEYEDGDVKGPLSVGVAVSKTIDDEVISHMVVLSSVMFFTDQANEVVSGNHITMFTDILSQMTSETELSSLVIPTKELTLSNITIDTMTYLAIGFVIMIAVPFVLFATGIVIWAIRRKK